MAKYDYMRVWTRNKSGGLQRRWVRPQSLTKYVRVGWADSQYQKPLYARMQVIKAIRHPQIPTTPLPSIEPGVKPYVLVILHIKVKYSWRNPHKDVWIDGYIGMTVPAEEWERGKDELVSGMQWELIRALKNAFSYSLINSIHTMLELGKPQVRPVDMELPSFIRIDRRYHNGIWKTLAEYPGPTYDWFIDR